MMLDALLQNFSIFHRLDSEILLNNHPYPTTKTYGLNNIFLYLCC